MYPLKMVIFHSYVSLPEGNIEYLLTDIKCLMCDTVLVGKSSLKTWLKHTKPAMRKTARSHWWCQPIQKKVIESMGILLPNINWLVVQPLWKIWVRQWEGLHPIYEMENKIHVPNHQPVSIYGFLRSTSKLQSCGKPKGGFTASCYL